MCGKVQGNRGYAHTRGHDDVPQDGMTLLLHAHPERHVERLRGLGFGGWGCGVCGLWFMVYGLWCMVYGVWFIVYDLWFRV
jgi:hypothetical protein